MSLTSKLVNSGINILRDTAVKHVNQQLPHNLRFALNAKPKKTRKRKVGRTPRGGRRFSSGKSSSGEVINQGGQGGNVNLYFNGHPQGGNGSFYNPYQMSQSNALPLHNSLREYQNEGYAERDNRATELAENLGASATQVIAGGLAEGVANVVRGGTFLGGLASGAGSTLSMLAVPLVGAGVVGAGSYLLTEEGRHNAKQLFGKVKTEGGKVFKAGTAKFSGSKVGSLFGSKKDRVVGGSIEPPRLRVFNTPASSVVGYDADTEADTDSDKSPYARPHSVSSIFTSLSDSLSLSTNPSETVISGKSTIEGAGGEFGSGRPKIFPELFAIQKSMLKNSSSDSETKFIKNNYKKYLSLSKKKGANKEQILKQFASSLSSVAE